MKDDTLEQRTERFREIIGDPNDGMALVSLLDEPAKDGACVSCGIELTAKESVRCNLCANALWTVLFNSRRPRHEVIKPRRSTRDLNEYDD